MTKKQSERPEWIRQTQHSISSVQELGRHLALSSEEKASIARASEQFPLKIPPYYLSLIDPHDPDCPIRKMAVPDEKELTVLPSELEDPIGDANETLNNQPVPSLIHRYPDRVVFMPTSQCSLYCRHCFRRRLAGSAHQPPSEKQIVAAINYIKGNRDINEVILSGGDPLMMSDPSLLFILGQINEISHVRVLRIHTRIPVVNPFRITKTLAESLRQFRPLWIVTHINHPKEITETAKKHLSRLADQGIPMLNQAVLLKGVNDSVDSLMALGWELIGAGVQPYYLHHLDRAQGLSHFRVSVRKGLELIRQLQGKLPGYAIHRYVLDIPNGHGKVPLQYHYLNTDAQGHIYAETPAGDYVAYADEEVEKPVHSDRAPCLRPMEMYPNRIK